MVWSKISSALFVDESKPKSTPGQTPIPAPGTPLGASTSAPSAGVMTPAQNPFADALRAAIKNRPTAFTSLLAAADKLANIIPDPTTRLKAAYATVSGEGRGLREVVGAIDVHVADLEAQKMQFMQALERQRREALGAIEAELSSLPQSNNTANAQIQAMTQQIQQLQELIVKNNARIAELQANATAESTKFTTSQQQFEAALVLVRGELEGQKSAVMSTLT
jgi:chromosome segregation ATPase